jgi:hypothetical protein
VDRTALVEYEFNVQLVSMVQLLVFPLRNALVRALLDTGVKLVRGIGKKSEFYF